MTSSPFLHRRRFFASVSVSVARKRMVVASQTAQTVFIETMSCVGSDNFGGSTRVFLSKK